MTRGLERPAVMRNATAASATASAWVWAGRSANACAPRGRRRGSGATWGNAPLRRLSRLASVLPSRAPASASWSRPSAHPKARRRRRPTNEGNVTETAGHRSTSDAGAFNRNWLRPPSPLNIAVSRPAARVCIQLIIADKATHARAKARRWYGGSRLVSGPRRAC
jgi:hypothetical protein